MSKINHDDDLPDLTSWKIKFSDLKNARDLLEHQVHDLEKNLAIATDRAERAEADLERTRAQLASANQVSTEYRTLISGIAQMIIPIIKTEQQRANAALPIPVGSPPRVAHGDGISREDRRAAMARVEEEINSLARQIGADRPPHDDEPPSAQ